MGVWLCGEVTASRAMMWRMHDTEARQGKSYNKDGGNLSCLPYCTVPMSVNGGGVSIWTRRHT